MEPVGCDRPLPITGPSHAGNRNLRAGRARYAPQGSAAFHSGAATPHYTAPPDATVAQRKAWPWLMTSADCTPGRPPQLPPWFCWAAELPYGSLPDGAVSRPFRSGVAMRGADVAACAGRSLRDLCGFSIIRNPFLHLLRRSAAIRSGGGFPPAQCQMQVRYRCQMGCPRCMMASKFRPPLLWIDDNFAHIPIHTHTSGFTSGWAGCRYMQVVYLRGQQTPSVQLGRDHGGGVDLLPPSNCGGGNVALLSRLPIWEHSAGNLDCVEGLFLYQSRASHPQVFRCIRKVPARRGSIGH